MYTIGKEHDLPFSRIIQSLFANMASTIDDLASRVQKAVTCKSPGTSRESSPRKKSKFGKFARKKSKSVSIERSNSRKDYYLYPIGSLGTECRPKDLIDVATIIEQGIFTHKNIDQRPHKKPEYLTTLSLGSLATEYSRKMLYAVQPIILPMVNLQELLDINAKSRIFGETHAKFVCFNLMLALRFLHSHKIFHGSICPAKVVFNERNYPCLRGFGTADILDERQSRPRERTQLEYTTAEQLWNEHMTEKVDMFAVGCLTYAMIYGKPPHQGDQGIETRRNINDKSFAPSFAPERISHAAERFISRCIRKRTRDRYKITYAKGSLPDNISWFSNLCEDKIYKQTAPSPITSVIKKHFGNKKNHVRDTTGAEQTGELGQISEVGQTEEHGQADKDDEHK